jgi:hypothetical protein
MLPGTMLLGCCISKNQSATGREMICSMQQRVEKTKNSLIKCTPEKILSSKQKNNKQGV